MNGYLPFREDLDEAKAELSDDEDNPFSGGDDVDDNLDPATNTSMLERYL